MSSHLWIWYKVLKVLTSTKQNHGRHTKDESTSGMLRLYREMERVAALVHNVSATFGRRDFLRRHMDKIEAMIADSGAS